jgi:hypothetical protein
VEEEGRERCDAVGMEMRERERNIREEVGLEKQSSS